MTLLRLRVFLGVAAALALSLGALAAAEWDAQPGGGAPAASAEAGD
jgi:Flp pilus assembly protein CpaB